jgi:hypothetical protein
MRLGAILAAMCLALMPLPALAGSFDGKWIAEMPPQSPSCFQVPTIMRVLVMDNQIMGQVIAHSATFSGTIDTDGSGNFSFGKVTGVIKFTGNRFDADWNSISCGHIHASGDREPSDTRKAEMAAERKQMRDRFAALVADAEAGKAVDYGQLRAAYPYTTSWDPYGNKTDAILEQAVAAQKGGDCVTALDKLDQIIKTDFTIDGAHALRADCLGKDKGATENVIANGLIHSLMDSGDGASEKTGYVVVTMREERDVLANRHIQTKTRQTNVRGSDGHYYDRVDGISLKNGVAENRTLFFDVSAFTAGRLSRDAEITTVAATIH